MIETTRIYLPKLVKAVAKFSHPYFIARSSLISIISSYAPTVTGSLLDVGCGSRPYRELFSNCRCYNGLELLDRISEFQGENMFFFDGKSFPFPPASFSAVLCSQVLEHSEFPDTTLSEIQRVLQQGGLLLLSIPFIWPEHEQPHDFQRFTSYGLLNHVRSAGFDVLELRKSCIGFSALLQILIEYHESLIRRVVPVGFHPFYRSLFRPIYLILNLFSMSLTMLQGGINHAFSTQELYLDLFIVAIKK